MATLKMDKMDIERKTDFTTLSHSSLNQWSGATSNSDAQRMDKLALPREDRDQLELMRLGKVPMLEVSHLPLAMLYFLTSSS